MARTRKARFRLKGVSAGITDAINLTIIIRWCSDNNGSFILGKEGGRGRGRVGLSRWRVVLLDGPNLGDLGRRGERVMFDESHADISMIVAKAARRLEDRDLGLGKVTEGARGEDRDRDRDRDAGRVPGGIQKLRNMTLEEILTTEG